MPDQKKIPECKYCAQGHEPALVDEDGTLCRISGKPGVLSHHIDDAFWPCKRSDALYVRGVLRFGDPGKGPVFIPQSDTDRMERSKQLEQSLLELDAAIDEIRAELKTARSRYDSTVMEMRILWRPASEQMDLDFEQGGDQGKGGDQGEGDPPDPDAAQE